MLSSQARKTLLVPTPRLRTGLFNKITPPQGATKEQLRICASAQVSTCIWHILAWLLLISSSIIVFLSLSFCTLNLFLQGVKDFSAPIGLDAKVKVDLVVVGSVAVSEKGNNSYLWSPLIPKATECSRIKGDPWQSRLVMIDQHCLISECEHVHIVHMCE